MKIICVEEHTSDQGLAKAGQPTQQSEAGYMAEVGTYFEGSTDGGDNKRPMLIGFQTSGKLAADLGAGRIANMDEHGIDMQILSCSNPPQNAPADQEISSPEVPTTNWPKL